MKKTSVELKVGGFVLVALILLAVLVFKAGDFYLKPGYTVKFIFDSVSGVESGSPVRLAGVNVGEVKSVQAVRNAEGKTYAEVVAWIAQGVLIEQDAEVRVSSIGFLGERYVEILPGTMGSATVVPGAVLTGLPPVGLGKLTESGSRLIGKLEYGVDNMNKVITDPAFQADVKNTFSDAAKVSKNLQETTEDLKDAAKSARIVLGRMRDGEGTIGRLMKDDKVAKDLEAFVAEIKAHPWKLLKRD